MDKNQKIVITITSILLVLVSIVGITYALEIFKESSGDNTIKSGKVAMSYTESSNVINIENALPMTDDDGKTQTNYFDFSITSDAKTNADDSVGITIPYDLIIEPKAIDSDKDALLPEQIKIFLTKIENGTETKLMESTKISELTAASTNFNLYSTENIHKNGNGAITTKYRLRAWIDYNVESKDWTTPSKKKQYKFAVNVNSTREINTLTGAETLITKVGTGGLVVESHPTTEQLQATTDYRYTGYNPDNYVSFNNELWRIIGVFDTDDGTGNIEQRIKLVRNESLGNISWDTHETYGINDWSTATGMTLLNSGDYWNRTGSYASTGLTAEAKAIIDDAKWYLGSAAEYESPTNGLVSHFYGYERGTTVYGSNPASWVGKVGLMYPSDYGYATSGGTTTNREACLAKEIYNWYDYNDCYNNDWLYNSSLSQWTLTPYSGLSFSAFYVNNVGSVGGHNVNDAIAVRPSIYLKSDVLISGGSGTSTAPYQLSL